MDPGCGNTLVPLACCGPDKVGQSGFKYFSFSPLLGEDSHFDYYFSDGLKPPTSYISTAPKFKEWIRESIIACCDEHSMKATSQGEFVGG